MTLIKKSYRHTYATKQRAAIDLSLSGNPLGPSQKVAEALVKSAEKVHLYPCEEEALVSQIARHHQIPEDSILLGAGANELLESYLKVFALGKNIVVPAATFPESVSCMSTLQGAADEVPLHGDMHLNLDALLTAVKPHTAFIHLCNPNNPTGIWTETDLLLHLADQSPVPLLISEAGADFVGLSLLDLPLHPNIIVVRSFSKAYGLAGLRIGYSVASPAIISIMNRNLRSYRICSLAIAAARAALDDQEHLQKSIAYIMREKSWLMREMNDLNFKIIPSEGQCFIAQVPEKFGTADQFCQIAKQYGVAVVNCSLYQGLEQYIRMSPQKRETNKKYVLILKIMGEKNE